jgi:hypothetical protein
VSVLSLAPRVLDAGRADFENRWSGRISTNPSSSAFYFPNVFSTAFNATNKPFYLFDVTSQNGATNLMRRAAVLTASRTGEPRSTGRLGQITAAGVRTGISTDIFAPMYPILPPSSVSGEMLPAWGAEECVCVCVRVSAVGAYLTFLTTTCHLILSNDSGTYVGQRQC